MYETDLGGEVMSKIKIVDDPFEGRALKVHGISEEGKTPYIAFIDGPDKKYKYKRKFQGELVEYSDHLECILRLERIPDGQPMEIRTDEDKSFYIFQDGKVNPILEGDLRKMLIKRIKNQNKVVELGGMK